MDEEDRVASCEPEGEQQAPDELNEDIVERGRRDWRDLKTHRTWEKWKGTGFALLELRREAQRRVNRGVGHNSGGYARGFSELLNAHGFGDMEKTLRADLLSCMEQIEAIDAWLATLDTTRRLDWNNPRVVLRAFKKATKVPEPDDEDETEDEGGEDQSVDEEIADAINHNDELTLANKIFSQLASDNDGTVLNAVCALKKQCGGNFHGVRLRAADDDSRRQPWPDKNASKKIEQQNVRLNDALSKAKARIVELEECLHQVKQETARRAASQDAPRLKEEIVRLSEENTTLAKANIDLHQEREWDKEAVRLKEEERCKAIEELARLKAALAELTEKHHALADRYCKLEKEADQLRHERDAKRGLWDAEMSEEEIGSIVWDDFHAKMSAEKAGAVVFELMRHVPLKAKLAAVEAKRKKPAQIRKSSKHHASESRQSEAAKPQVLRLSETALRYRMRFSPAMVNRPKVRELA